MQQDNVNARAVALFAMGLTAVGLVVYLAVWGLFGFLNGREAANNSREYPLAAEQEQRLPPEPRLQTNPRGDLRELRDQEDDLLTKYRWVDKSAGVVRVPIDRAMQLTLERGLPARKEGKK
ncbi:MAG TPA: hypothetical protein VHZ73_07685 [Vicinamibacterales bacterium]|nr:hypothetical protein [Vicinamibacterales bacterium]